MSLLKTSLSTIDPALGPSLGAPAEPSAGRPAAASAGVATEQLALAGPRRRWRVSDQSWARAITPVALLAIWQLGGMIGFLPTRTLSSPASVARTFWDLASSGDLAAHLSASLRRSVTGLALGILGGLGLGVAAGLFKLGEKIVDPAMQMLRSVPMLALAPLFVIWFGIYERPKILLIALGTTYHIYVNVYGGIRNVDSRLVEAGVTLGLTRRGLLRHVIVPGALPQALIGLRLALASSWLLLVVAEQINTKEGLGALLDRGRTFMRTELIVVVLVVYAVLGILADVFVRWLERRALAWRRTFAGQ